MKVVRPVFEGWDILVVDDSVESLNILEVSLKRYGATVHRAADGKEALASIAAVRPKLIITDLAMPVLDGWELIRYLKQDDDLKLIPIVALTAHATVTDRQRAVEAGCDTFVTKPIMPSVFIGELIDVLRGMPELELDE